VTHHSYGGGDPRSDPGLRQVWLAAGTLAALTCAYSWPLIAHPGSLVPHDKGDPLLVTWILWWSTHTVPLTTAWWNAPAFYPSPGVLAFSENLLGLAPITTPIIALTHAPLVGYNTAFLLSYLLSGLGAYLLAFVLTRRHDASFVAAAAFAFAPYRLSHLHHLQLLSSYWMPVSIAALHLYAGSPKRRWAALFAASWLLQALACGYYLFYLTILVILWLAWFAPRRLAMRDLARLAVAWGIAGLAIAPILLGYRAIHTSYGFRRSPVEIINYSADIAGLWSASPDSLAWRWLDGGVSSESQQFPGLTLVLLCLSAVAIIGPLRRQAHPASARTDTAGYLPFYGLTAVLMWTMSLGPAPALHGRPLGLPGPYALLASLPGFNGMRVPARLWMVSVLCLAVFAAIVVARIEGRRVRRLVAAIATLGLLLDGWPRAFPVFTAPGMRVTTTVARARLGLPLRENETETMYGSIAQARPVFNGYSGYEAPQHFAMRDLLEHFDPRILDRLAAAEPIEVIIEAAHDRDGAWTAYLQRQAGARRVDVSPEWTSYEIPTTGRFAPPEIAGTPVRVTSIATSTNTPDIEAILDGNLDTRWHTPPQAGGEWIVADLGRAQRVKAIVLCLGAYAAQYPRGLAVEVSPDGLAWSPVSHGGTALETYDAAVRSPREIPLTLAVQRDGVRFIRLRQTGSDARYGWTIVELRVIG
jgi:F5/8 type C domain